VLIHSSVELVEVSTQAAGVYDAGDREFLLMGPCAGEASCLFCWVGRVCGRRDRKCSGHLSLVDSPVRESGIPSTSARAIVRNTGTFEAPKTVQDRPMVEAPLRPAATETVSGRDEPVTQMEAGHQARVHGEPQKHSQVVIHSRILETIYPRFFAEGTPQLLVRRTGRATQPFRQTNS
jgi:hypothetical protein